MRRVALDEDRAAVWRELEAGPLTAGRELLARLLDWERDKGALVERAQVVELHRTRVETD